MEERTLVMDKEAARAAWEAEKDLIFPDRVALRKRLNAPKKDTEKDLAARVGALEGQIAAAPVRPVVSAPARPAAPATPRQTPAQMEARRAATESEAFRRIRERL